MQIQEDQWRKLEAVIPGRRGRSGVSGKNNRLFIEAIILISEGRFCWTEIPSIYGAWNTTYMRFRRWNMSGIWGDLENAAADDPALLRLMQGVNAYSRDYQSMLEEKTRRRKYRENFSRRAGVVNPAIAAENNRPDFPGEDIEPNWVQLMGGDSPNILLK